MNWLEDLGAQIKVARVQAGLTQLQLAEMTSVKREHISNIELGKHSPAVKIVTDIARALQTTFRIEGCLIEPSAESSEIRRPLSVAQQLKLDFGVGYRFDARHLSVTAISSTEIELHATLSRKRMA